MSSQGFSSTSGAAKRGAKKRKVEEIAKISGSMHKFIVVNKPESQNSTATSRSVEVELLHADNVNELDKVQFNTKKTEEESTVSTDDSTVSSQLIELNAHEQQASEAVTTHDDVEANMHQSDVSVYIGNASNGWLMDSECQVMNIDTPAEYNAIINNNPHDEKLIDISYTLDSASHPAGERKLKPDRSRILREAAILVVPTERDNLYILYCGNGQS